MREELEQLADLAFQFFESPNAEREQIIFVRKVLRSIGYSNLGCGVVAGAIAAFLVPILLIWAKTLPMGGRVPVFTFAVGLAAFPLVMLYKAIRSFFGTVFLRPANSLEDALERFYQKALGDSIKSLLVNDRSELLKYTVSLFPKPVFQQYSKRLLKIAKEWDEFRKRFAKEEESFKVEITNLQVQRKTPYLYDVKFKIFDVWLKNLAFENGNRWYLLNMYPDVSEPEEGKLKTVGEEH